MVDLFKLPPPLFAKTFLAFNFFSLLLFSLSSSSLLRFLSVVVPAAGLSSCFDVSSFSSVSLLPWLLAMWFHFCQMTKIKSTVCKDRKYKRYRKTWILLYLSSRHLMAQNSRNHFWHFWLACLVSVSTSLHFWMASLNISVSDSTSGCSAAIVDLFSSNHNWKADAGLTRKREIKK